MKNVIRRILYAGIKPGLSIQLSRTIILTNAIALTTTILCSLLLPYLLYRNDWSWSYLTKMIVVTIFVLIITHMFNNAREIQSQQNCAQCHRSNNEHTDGYHSANK